MKKFLRLRSQKNALSRASDEELLAAYQEGGRQEAFAELFNRYVHLVYGSCRRYFNGREDARDFTMMIFESILSQAKNAEIEDFSKWLFAASRNFCISRLRQAERAERYQGDWESFEKSSPEFMENEGFLRLYNREKPESKGMEAHITKAIAKLEKGQRACIRLFFFEKKSYKDIARQTGYSVKQVKSHLQNGKRNLRTLLMQTHKKNE